jgi:hypothetical protein
LGLKEQLAQLAQQQLQLIFKFFQLPVHTLGQNLLVQNLFMLLLLVVAAVVVLGK